jgi:DNA mismatch endonuclease, patch repair protein
MAGERATLPFKRIDAVSRSLRTSAERSAQMARVRQSGTAPEMVVRAVCRVLGFRFTTDNRDLPGSPDLANRRRGIAIFVHGCYWHRHANCRRTTTPARNREFWEAKFIANVRRDRRAIAALRRLGYRVMVVWECRARLPAALERRMERFLGRD